MDTCPNTTPVNTAHFGRLQKIKGVPPGSYIIAAYQRDEGQEVYEPRGQQKIEVSGENINSLTITLDGGTSFQGRVTVAGAGSPALDQMGVRLSRIDEDDQVGGHGRVKKDGTFEIKGVNDGDYAIAVWGLQNNWYVKSVRLGGQELLEKGLQLEKGGSGGRLEVIVSAASAQMEGSVSESDDRGTCSDRTRARDTLVRTAPGQTRAAISGLLVWHRAPIV